jgi:membrane protein implicated in regulation of membrane protease activity
MLTLRRGRITAVVERVEGLSRLEVDGEPSVAYPRLPGPVALGDEVIVNTQAREL